MSPIFVPDPLSLAVILFGLALGGIIKGATGAGLPIVAVPIIAAVYDVRLAVVVLVIPSFVTNLSQVHRYRSYTVSGRFTAQIVGAGMVGAAMGTWILVALPADALNLLMATIILAYIALRLWRPDFRISQRRADRIAWIAGGLGGVLQGALGISAPIAVTFLNAVRLDRPSFVFTVSAFFASMCIPQFLMQVGLGLMTVQIATVGLLAIVPLMLALRVGEWFGTRMSPAVFDRVILGLLAVLSAKLVLGALTA